MCAKNTIAAGILLTAIGTSCRMRYINDQLFAE